MRTKLLTFGTAFVLLSAGTPAWADGEKPRGLPAEVVTVAASVLDNQLSAVGTLEASEQVIIRPEQSGLIEKIGFTEGQPVKKDQVLFKLNTDTHQAQVAQANARVSLSKSQYQRANQLLQKRVGSANDRDSTLAQLRVDEALLTVARTQLDKMTITAPFDGVTGFRSVSPGDYVSAGQDLVTLVDVSEMKVEFDLPEVALSQIHNGQQVQLHVSAFPERTFTGEVFAISPVVSARSRSLKVKAKVANSDGLLRPGLFAKITIMLGQNDQALMIPEQAIIPNNKAFLVMTMGPDHKIAVTPVSLGARRNSQVQILSGLQAGDVVVTAGHLKLRPGMPITPLFPKPEATSSQPQSQQQKG